MYAQPCLKSASADRNPFFTVGLVGSMSEPSRGNRATDSHDRTYSPVLATPTSHGPPSFSKMGAMRMTPVPCETTDDRLKSEFAPINCSAVT